MLLVKAFPLPDERRHLSQGISDDGKPPRRARQRGGDSTVLTFPLASRMSPPAAAKYDRLP